MKIPQVFILEKPSENKLEDLLKGKDKTRIKRVSPHEYECYCNICGDLAGSIKIVLGGTSPDYSRISRWPGFDLDFNGRTFKKPSYEEPKLLIKNFYGTIEVPPYYLKDRKFLESVITDLDKKDLKSVFEKLDGNYLTFYNLDDDKCYCWTHWLAYQDEQISKLR